MFLSVATSNMVATSLAKQVGYICLFLVFQVLKLLYEGNISLTFILCFFLQDKKEAQHQISVLLFIGLVCGLMMLLLTRLFGPWAVTGIHFSLPNQIFPFRVIFE